VPAVTDALLRGEEALVTPGMQIRDFLHVHDVASGIIAVANSVIDDAVNVGSGEPVTVAAIATKIGILLGCPERVKLGARGYSPGEPMFICADNTKLRSTGWKRRYSTDAGLAQVVESRR
jgi:nucleoside-diphosphate-sugar epimerase